MPEPAPQAANKVIVRRIINAPREDVFAAWLDPKGMSEWFCPGNVQSTDVQLDARVGGKFRIVMKKVGEETEHTGQYTVIDKPSKLAFTWISNYTDNQPTLVTIEFHARGKQCEVVLTHDGFPKAELAVPHQGGWTSIVEKLDAYIAKRQ
jgi:uncharacterized protein YndB with AHSA1/START domain